MKRLKEPSTFVFGLVFGGLVGLIAWYWYKSTSAEDGALDLLDRMAAAERRLKNMAAEAPQGVQEFVENYITLEPNDDSLPPFLNTAKTEDLQRVKGIGPVFADRLQEAGVNNVAALTAVSPKKLAEILDISEGRAANILAEAVRL